MIIGVSKDWGCAPFNGYYLNRRDDDKASFLPVSRFQTNNNMLCQLVSLKHPRWLNDQTLSRLEGKSTGGHVDQSTWEQVMAPEFSGLRECLTIAHWQGMASNNVDSKNGHKALLLIIKLS